MIPNYQKLPDNWGFLFLETLFFLLNYVKILLYL